MSTINERVRLVRQHFKMSQAEFAAKIYVHNGFLSALEHGNKRVTERVRKLVSVTFGVNEEWLQEGTGDMIAADNPDYEIQEIVELYKQLSPYFKTYFRRQLKDLMEYERLNKIESKSST
jgi:transcriptional regulator with XRE-family HTH domain